MFILIFYYYLVINFYGIENGISETVNRNWKEKREEAKNRQDRKEEKTYLVRVNFITMSWSLLRLYCASISWSPVSWDDFMGQTPPLGKCYLGPNQLNTRLPSLIKVYTSGF